MRCVIEWCVTCVVDVTGVLCDSVVCGVITER